MKWKNRLYWLALLATPWLHNCATQKHTVYTESDRLEVPAGVDSAVAQVADTLARELFVPWGRQVQAREKAKMAETEVEKSNALWQALTAERDSVKLAPEDTVRAIEKFNQAGKELQQAIQLQKSERADQEEIKKRILAHLEAARRGFEAAIQLNPFDPQTRLWLARVYQMLAQRFLSARHWEKAAEVLENLVRVERGQHGLFGRLAQSYLALERWDRALENFQKAERVLRQTAVFQVPEDRPLQDETVAAALDSATLFLYVFYQGESHIRMFQADSALYHLQRALPMARNANERNSVQSTIDWINWDDGNIAASIMRDSLLAQVDRKEYDKAARGFSGLLANLNSGKAKREINWRLALLEFSFLGQEERALSRMQEVVRFYLADSTVAPGDTMKAEYFDSYGTMCHNMGLQALKDKKYKRALAYFQQSVSIPWKQRAKSQLEIAKLSLNNPRRAHEAAVLAWASRTQLDFDEKKTVLRILVESLKRLGKFAEATDYFREYRNFVTQTSQNQ